MARDNRFERVQQAYAALTYGEGFTAPTGHDAMQLSYDRGDADEFVKPTVIVEDGKPVGRDENGAVVFYSHPTPLEENGNPIPTGK